jgi:hypothetical protein
LINGLVPLAIVAVSVAVQIANANAARARRRAAEELAAVAPVPSRPAPAAPAAAPSGKRVPQPIARLPKRVDTPVAAPARPPLPPVLGAPGPRWAANAIVAAEVFGPPLALRERGTLGPPPAL